METIKIILSAAVVVIGLFGETFNRKRKKLKAPGWMILILTIPLILVEIIIKSENEEDNEALKSTISSTEKRLEETKKALLRSESILKETKEKMEETEK